MDCKGLSSVLSSFEKCFESTEQFFQVQNDKAEIFKSMTKALSDLAQQTNDNEEISHKVLPALIIENFDEEQVWQQLELRNTPVTTYFNKCFKSLCVDDITFGVKKPDIRNCHNNFTTEVDLSSEEISDYAFDGSDSDNSEAPAPDNVSPLNNKKVPKKYGMFNSAPVVDDKFVDDKFFKVSQLEEFLKYEDLKEEREQHGSGSDESDIDLFADIPSDDEAIDSEPDDEDEECAQKEKSAKDIMYKDFFDPPELENEPFADSKFDISATQVGRFGAKDKKANSSDGKQKTVRFSQNIESSKKLQLLSDSDDDDAVLNKNSKYSKSSSKTAFEKQQEKERQKIKELEASLLKKKPWQFTGEVAADSRPQDSLLHQNTEFDSNLKQDFVTTDEVTERVENIIRMVISNKAWCDVEVKVKPIEDALTYKPAWQLDQTKSKKGLAEVYAEEYEEEYRKKSGEEESEKEDAQHVEIRKLMDSVASSLSNLFSHTPRPPIPEIKVIRNMPAITIEEVAPVFVSDAALLAPEEIKPKSGLPISKSERTETDKKRERRKKKKLQKIRKLKKEEKDKKKAAISKKEAGKFAKQQALKKLSQQKNVTIIQGKKHLGKMKF